MAAMAEEFRAFDQALFPAPSCTTCHDEGSWQMPNPKLPPLDPDGRFDVEMRHSPEFTMFMVKRVQPRMRELLEEPGLDCFTCHTRRER